MKKALFSLLILLTAASSLSAESIQELSTNTDSLYRSGAGSKDGASTALATSMIGWGVGLAIVIGVLAAVLHESNASSSSSSSHAHCK
jgi:hypothetical protein